MLTIKFFICLIVVLNILQESMVTALTCEDCPGCAGTCRNTPRGQICSCDGDKTGSNCNLCLLRSGWIDGENGYQYLISSEEFNYFDAQAFCEKFGAHLAIYGPRDPVWQAANISTFNEEYIGLSDRNTERMYYWNDGVLSTESYTPWSSTQPDHTDTQNCAVIRQNGVLDVIGCNNLRKALCEAPIGSPPQIPKFLAKNDCEYYIIPPAFQHVSEELCSERGGVLAVRAVNSGNVLKKLLYYYSQNGQIPDGSVFTGFERQGSLYETDGVVLNVSAPTAEWHPGNPGDVLKDCIIAKLTPDWLDYAWVEDVSCHQVLPGLCEFCNETISTNDSEKTCKSGKVCTRDHTICVIHEGTCFEECACVEGYEVDIFSGECIQAGKCDAVSCGSNACCYYNSSTDETSCRCESNYLPSGLAEGDGCSYPNCTCNNNSTCVRNISSYEDICICKDNYIPDIANPGDCIEDQCALGNVTCGGNSSCCLTDAATATFECVCDEGFYYVDGSVTNCFDPCDASLITCGQNAICVANKTATPVASGVCVCKENFTAVTSPEDGCIPDRCANGDLDCGNNSTCCIVNATSGEQACVCKDGFYKTTDTPESGCFDPCDSVTCSGATESCTVNTTSTPITGVCECNEDFFRNLSSGDCVPDSCVSSNCIEGVCGFDDPPNLAQGCICKRGFTFVSGSTTNCSACPQTKWEFPNKVTSDNLEVTSPSDMRRLNFTTLCAWLTPIDGELQGALFSYATDIDREFFYIRFLDANTHRITVYSDTEKETMDFDLTITTTTHVCYVMARYSFYLQVYADGKLRGTGQYDKNESNEPVIGGKIFIGVEQGAVGGSFSTPLKGIVENLYVYDRVLSRGEIQLMANDKCACPPLDYYLSLQDTNVVVNGGVVNGVPDAACSG